MDHLKSSVLPCLSADAPAPGTKVILNEYGTPITVPADPPTPAPPPPLQGPAPPPTTSFADDDYGDQIIDFAKADKPSATQSEIDTSLCGLKLVLLIEFSDFVGGDGDILV